MANVLGPAEMLQPVASHPFCRASGVYTQLRSFVFFMFLCPLFTWGDCTTLITKQPSRQAAQAGSLGPFTAWLCGI